MKSIKDYIAEQKESKQFTGNQIEFLEAMIEAMGSEGRLFDAMVQIGDMTKPFELLQQYCHNNLRNATKS